MSEPPDVRAADVWGADVWGADLRPADLWAAGHDAGPGPRRSAGARGDHAARGPAPAPGHGEAVLRVAHAGFDRHKLFTTLCRDGSEEPLVVGADAAGVVAAVGPDVDPGPVGARRLLNPCPGWPMANRVPEQPRILGSAAPGTFAEYVAVPVECLAAVPAHLAPAEAGASRRPESARRCSLLKRDDARRSE